MKFYVNHDKAIINLGTDIKISTIAEQKNVYLQAIANGAPIEIQADVINSLDTASLQLLLSFTITAAQKNIRIDWLDASDELRQACKLLGIDQTLKIHLPI